MRTRELQEYDQIAQLIENILRGSIRIRQSVPLVDMVVYEFYHDSPRTESITTALDCWPFAEWVMHPQRREYFLSRGGTIVYQDWFNGVPSPRYARAMNPDSHGYESLFWLHNQLKALTVLDHPT